MDRPSSPNHDAANEPKSSKRLKKPALPPELDPGPDSVEPPMDTEVQFVTILTMVTCLKWAWRDRKNYFIGSNLSIYYYVTDPRSGAKRHKKLVFRGPDFFVVLNPFPKKLRNSWLVDNEGGKYPDIIVEILSTKTRHKDVGEKKEIYEKVFKTHEYFLVDPKKRSITGYRLSQGKYVLVEPTKEGLVFSERLGLYLGMHDEPEHQDKIARFFGPDKRPLALPPEELLRQMSLVEKQKQRVREAEARAQRAEREKAELLEKLRSLGVNVDEFKSK